MNSDILQKLEVMSHLLTIEHIQIKHQLEIDARLAEFEQNRERTTPINLSRMKKNPNEHIIRNIKIDAPSFDGTLEPQLFLDQIKEMDHYF